MWLSGVCFLFAQESNTGSHNLNIVFPEVALLDIESEDGSDINFIIENQDLAAGEEFEIHEQNEALWLNYTSLVAQNGATRAISVHSTSVLEIPGLDISIEALSHSGVGGGSLGSPTSVVVPSTTATNIITGIGSAFTGDGVTNGHKLVYSLDYTGSTENLHAMNGDIATISIVYTITD